VKPYGGNGRRARPILAPLLHAEALVHESLFLFGLRFLPGDALPFVGGFLGRLGLSPWVRHAEEFAIAILWAAFVAPDFGVRFAGHLPEGLPLGWKIARRVVVAVAQLAAIGEHGLYANALIYVIVVLHGWLALAGLHPLPFVVLVFVLSASPEEAAHARPLAILALLAPDHGYLDRLRGIRFFLPLFLFFGRLLAFSLVALGKVIWKVYDVITHEAEGNRGMRV